MHVKVSQRHKCGVKKLVVCTWGSLAWCGKSNLGWVVWFMISWSNYAFYIDIYYSRVQWNKLLLSKLLRLKWLTFLSKLICLECLTLCFNHSSSPIAAAINSSSLFLSLRLALVFVPSLLLVVPPKLIVMVTDTTDKTSLQVNSPKIIPSIHGVQS